MESNLNRIRDRIQELAKFNATPDLGVTRFSYSREDRMARDYIINEMILIGLGVTVDAVGNIRGRMIGRENNEPPVMTGSHIDTVFHGGKFDGAVGTVCALEALTVLSENHVVLRRPVEIIVFAEEEGSNFNSTMAGSKTLVGKYSVEDLKNIHSSEGMSMFEMAADFGLHPETAPDYILNAGDIHAMIEIHVEQSVVLDSKGIAIGIVEAIYGSKCLKITLKGEPNHAGATPMNLRKDPIVAAAEIISGIDNAVKNEANSTTVATVGKIICSPNVSNCIAGEVCFTVDIRDVEDTGIETVCSAIEKLVGQAAYKTGTEASIENIAQSDVVRMSDKVINIIEKAAIENNTVYQRINSGAVHDSAMFAKITDTGMIFVPSIKGRSHVPEEDTSFDDIKQGCDLLLKSLIMLAE